MRNSTDSPAHPRFAHEEPSHRGRRPVSPWILAGCATLLTSLLVPPGSSATPVQDDPPRLIAWNDLGMHCIDPDFSVFSILPPFNTLNAQLVVNGDLVETEGGITLTYESVVDATGSINTTSIGKTNFWDHEDDLFGVQLPLDVGLTGSAMPGAGNVPQPMHFDPAWSWFQGEGIPVTPIDDAGAKAPYPLMRVTARSASGQVLATTVTSVPNSQELDCQRCHASGSSPFARPEAGWVFEANRLQDDRYNILRLHDELEGDKAIFQDALNTLGFDPAGLEATARGGRAILCDSCHGSNALPGTGLPDISPMTVAMHGGHAEVRDVSGLALGELDGRTSCYVCHPGFDTQCLRGAMGKAIGADGQFAMDCQSCHGSMQEVGDPARVGWLDQPTCQNCHSGTAVQHSGEIRYADAFDASGELRVAASDVFATTPDVPATGFSLYRFSTGHGGLQCSACHGPPHAIYPTSEPNDNRQSLDLQDHVGTITDCSVCHANLEDDEFQGPHGMHPVDAKWVRDNHKNAAEQPGANCQACHGTDYRGTVLSLAQGDRSYATTFGQKNFWRGFQIGCFACHEGPDTGDANPNRAPTVADRTESTPSDVALDLTLVGSDLDADPLTFRVIEQPANGTVAIQGADVTYRAAPGFFGTDLFTYAASDGDTQSALGTVTVNVTAPSCSGVTLEYGFGCPGEGGFVPALRAEGCPTPGDGITLTASEALGGVHALLVVGSGRAVNELWMGCVLRVDPILRVQPFELTGFGPGAGTGVLEIAFPPGTPELALTFQLFVRDHANGQPGVFSNAVGVAVR